MTLFGNGSSGGADQGFIRHSSHHQIFDIYLPDVICRRAATVRFIASLRKLCEGATFYQGVEGDWRDERESVRVFRFSIEIQDGAGRVVRQLDELRDSISQAANQLMLDLEKEHAHIEQAVFFNDWPATSTFIRRPGG